MDKMEIELFNSTPNALQTLVFTKSGRLLPGTKFEDVLKMPEEELLVHLSYMMDTIKSSFEFCHYYFQVTGVSRAFTHQHVRSRHLSFQQQAMRVVDARDFFYTETTDHPAYKRACEYSKEAYAEMVDDDVDVQDARGVLPTAIHTEIMVAGNLRTFSDMSEIRLCKRAEGEYQIVFQQMVNAIISIHPWAEPLLRVYCAKYAICAFPRYDKCPIQQYCFNPKDRTERILDEWKNCNHRAAPKANKDAMTM